MHYSGLPACRKNMIFNGTENEKPNKMKWHSKWSYKFQVQALGFHLWEHKIGSWKLNKRGLTKKKYKTKLTLWDLNVPVLLHIEIALECEISKCNASIGSFSFRSWTLHYAHLIIRLGQILKTLYFQLFLGRPCICKPKKCHSSTQKSNPRPGHLGYFWFANLVT